MGETILDRAISPAEAVEKLLMRGVKVTERSLREKARQIGAYRKVGREVFFLPEDLLFLMMAAKPGASVEDIRSWFAEDDEERADEAVAQAGGQPTGLVYFLECDDRVKIGYTTNLKERLKNFRTTLIDDFEVILTVPGTTALERHFHQRFDAYRIKGEWFSLSDEIRDFVSRRQYHLGGEFERRARG